MDDEEIEDRLSWEFVTPDMEWGLEALTALALERLALGMNSSDATNPATQERVIRF